MISSIPFFGRNIEQPIDISLYIHIPFCSGKCLYCDFYSLDTYEYSAAYLRKQISSVFSETIDQVLYMLSALNYPSIDTLYIGGGTPTIIPPDLFDDFLRKLFDSCGGYPSEISIEANPESLSDEHLAVFTLHKVTRLSVGIQTLDQVGGKVLGRRCTGTEMERCLDRVRRTWRGALSLDIICGIPGTSVDLCYSDCKRVHAEYHPEHISLYTLTIEEGTPLAFLVQEGTVIPLSDDAVASQWERCVAFLRTHYRNYEVSNFCKPGYACRHNVRYWQMKPYIGCGPAAVSTLPAGNRALRIQNPSDLLSFSGGRGKQWGVQIEEVGVKEYLFEHFMMGLRTENGVDLLEIEARFHFDPFTVFSTLFGTWFDKGYAVRSGMHLCLTGRGKRILNSLLIDLLVVMDDLRSYYMQS